MRSFVTSITIVVLVGVMVVSASTIATASSERDSVENLCRQMEMAYESQDQQAIIDLYEGLGSRGAKQVRRLFEDFKSVSIVLEFDKINPAGTEATVLMTHLSIVHNRGGRKLDTRPQQEFHLRKIHGEWKFVTPAYVKEAKKRLR